MIKIFDANETDFSSNGNIVIKPLKCIEYRKKSLNGWYIECEIPIKYKDYIDKDKLCIVKTRSKLNPQAFRIGDTIKKTNKKITFTANHVMFDAEDYFLMDVRPTNLNGAGALEYINSRTDSKSPFKVFSNVENVDTEYFERKTLFEAWSLMEERWQGVFDADNFNIYFLNKVGNDNRETIIYGKNMENMTILEDWSNVCTKVCAVGYDGLLLPEKYIESEVKYDKPYTKKQEFNTELDTTEATEEKLIEELRKNAIDYLNENKFPKVSYEVTSNINQLLEIGDIVHVKHPLVEIETEVLEYVNDIILDKIISLTFGNYTKDVKSRFDSIKSSISEVKERISKQDIAIKEQTSLINTFNKKGYVYIDDNEILILDQLPKEKAKNVWRFGLGGIAFSSNGYKGPFKVAMTMDGKINADFITTGKLSVNIIEGLAETLDEWSKIMINMKNIELLVHNTIDITRELEENTSILELPDCMEGNLLELKIFGDNNVFKDSSKIIVHSEDLKDKFEKKFAYRSLGYRAGFDSDYNIDSYKAYAKKSSSYNRCYIMPLEFGETYHIILDKNELSDSKWLYLATFSENLWENDTEEETVYAVNYYGTRRTRYNKDDSVWENYTNMDEFHITITPTEEEKYLAFYSYTASTFETAKIYENYQEVDLGVDEVLRVANGSKEDTGEEYIVRDSTEITGNISNLVRRVGVDEEGYNYILDTEEIFYLNDDLNIKLMKGTNYIEVVDYVADIYVKYVITNDYTDLFTTKIESEANFKMLSNKIQFAVTQGNIIAALNVGIENQLGVVKFKSNLFEVDSDNLKITRYGKIIATEGEIAGLTMKAIGNASDFYKELTVDGITYKSGLWIPDGACTVPFLYAGINLNESNGSVFDANAYITHEGKIYAKWFEVNGESGYFHVKYNSGRKAMLLDKSSISWYLDDAANGYIGAMELNRSGLFILLNDLKHFSIYDHLHENNMITFYRKDPNLPEVNSTRYGPSIDCYSNINILGKDDRNLNHTIRVQGYEVQTSASDERLKDNIKNCKESALEVVNKIPIIAFDWRKDINTKNAGKHIRFGYGARRTKKIFPDAVVHDEEYDTYQMQLLNISSLHTKAIQELYELFMEHIENCTINNQ